MSPHHHHPQGVNHPAWLTDGGTNGLAFLIYVDLQPDGWLFQAVAFLEGIKPSLSKDTMPAACNTPSPATAVFATGLHLTGCNNWWGYSLSEMFRKVWSGWMKIIGKHKGDEIFQVESMMWRQLLFFKCHFLKITANQRSGVEIFLRKIPQFNYALCEGGCSFYMLWINFIGWVQVLLLWREGRGKIWFTFSFDSLPPSACFYRHFEYRKSKAKVLARDH